MTILALTSLNCFSQIDTVKSKTLNTTNVISDTTKVVLSKEVAKEVIKDLIRLDGCIEELNLTQQKVVLLEEKQGQKDSIIVLLTEKDTINQSIILKKDEQLKISKELTDSLQTELKKKKRESLFYKIGSIIGVISTSLLIITWP